MVNIHIHNACIKKPADPLHLPVFYFLFTELEFGAVEGCKIVAGFFCTADQLEAAILFQQNFGAAELAVVIVTHGEAVGTGIMDAQNITDFNFRQASFNGELVVVFAQAAGPTKRLQLR